MPQITIATPEKLSSSSALGSDRSGASTPTRRYQPQGPKPLGHCRAPSVHESDASHTNPSLSQKRKLQKPYNSTSRIGWLASLNIDDEPVNLRKTGIICTIGPKTATVDAIIKLREAGMNVARLNFSHGSHEYHWNVVKAIRQSFEMYPGRPVAIALDTKGPEIRTGDLECPDGIFIEEGHVFILTCDPAIKTCGNLSRVYIDYPSIANTVTPSGLVYVDDGNLQLQVIEPVEKGVRVKALNAHLLLSRKGVNLPYSHVELPSVSDKDREDLLFAVEHGLDVVFASFIRSPADVLAIRQIVGPDIWIISKIENHEGIRNFDAILQVSDGIMVARGDLGIEIPVQKVFVAQKMMIAKCNLSGKPVICATQMLESMTVNPRPSRAEASDVANAVLDGADCVMLSAETARGNYPFEAVKIMDKICQEAESTIAYLPLFEEIRAHCRNEGVVTETVSSSAANAALEPYIRAIIVLTTTGESAFRCAKFRPQTPIITVTRNESLCRRLHLYRGLYPLLYTAPKPTELNECRDEWLEDVERRLNWAIEEGKRIGWLWPGDHVICIQGSRGGTGFTNTMRILPVP